MIAAAFTVHLTCIRIAMEFLDGQEYAMAAAHPPFPFDQRPPPLSSPSSPLPFDEHSCLESPVDVQSQQSFSTEGSGHYIGLSSPTSPNLPFDRYDPEVEADADAELEDAYSPLQLNGSASPTFSLPSTATSFGDSSTESQHRFALPPSPHEDQPHPDKDAVTSASDGVGTRQTSIKGRIVCKSACIPCRQSKTGCDGQRPCARCVAGDRTERCVDRPAEEIEQGRINRGRRTTKRARTSTPAEPRSAALADGDLPIPSVPVPPVLSSAAALAIGQATIMLTDLIDRADELCRTLPADDARRHPFMRAAHVLLAHMTDSMAMEQFLWLVRRSGWLEAPRRSSPLAVWGSSETWPLSLDWHSSPLLCSYRPVLADADVLEAAAVRVYCLPAASAALQMWEKRLTSTSDAHQRGRPREEAMETKALAGLFNCLLLSDGGDPVPDEEMKETESTEQVDAVARHHHASWCDVSIARRSSPPTAATRPPPSSAAAVLCTCERSIPLACCLQVNAAWERLFGWSQAEVRRQLIVRGAASMADWYTIDSWHAMHSLLASHAFTPAGQSDEFKAFSVMRHKDGHEMPCRMQKTVHSDELGLVSSFQSFTGV